MAIRTYGAVNAPGQRVEETTAPKPIQPGGLGTTYLLGVFERGPVGGPGIPPVMVRSESDLLRRRGGFKVLDGYFGPDAARQFLDMSQGAGALYTERVTDGSEVKASGSVLTRRCPRGVRYLFPDTLTPAALSWTAKWGGTAGGKAKVIGGAFLGMPGTTTLSTGKTLLKDELAGGTLVLRGVSSKTYAVLSNTTAGVITVDSDQDMLADLMADDPTDNGWAVEIFNAETDGRRRSVGLEIVPRGGRRPATEFGANVRLDRDIVQQYADLAMVTGTGKKEVESTVNQAVDNYEIVIDNLWTGADAPDVRPANWAGVAAAGGVSANTLTLWIVEWTRSGTGNGTLNPSLFNFGTDLRPGTITLTFTGATAYTVTSDLMDSIPAAVALGANDLHLLSPFLPGFTVAAGTTPFINGDTITLRIKALPTDGSMAGAMLWPDADGANAGTSIPVMSNTSRTVTVPAYYDLTTLCTEPGHAYVETLTAGPWNTQGPIPSYGPVGDLTGITVDGQAVATFEFPLSAALSAAALKAAWESHDPRNWAEVQTNGKLRMGSKSTGPLATFAYTGGTATGDILPAAPQSVVGTAGSLIVLQWAQEGRAGYDGTANLSDGRFVSALQPSGSVKEILGANIGQPMIVVSGVTGSTVHAAARMLASQIAGLYLPDMPQTTMTEDAALMYLSSTLGLSDFHAPFWPSWGYVDEADLQETDRLVPLSAMVAGLMARSFSSNGMGKAPAGLSMALSGVKRLLKANDDVFPDPELLNTSGIRTLTKRGGPSFVIWGARIPGDTEIWLHRRAMLNQLIREFLYPGNWDQFVFEINDPILWGQLAVSIRSLLMPHYEQGWFNRQYTFEQAVRIKVDADVNDSAAQAAGRLVAAVSYLPPNATEQVVFRLSQAGVSE